MRYSKGDFSAGEISPRLHGRPEFPAYVSGAKVMKNALPLPTGGWCNRPGTRAVAYAKTGGTKWRLVSFIFSTGDAFVLEFSNLCVRFFKGYAAVGAPYEVVTPWASADLANLKFAQSADTLFITDGSHQPRTLARISDTSWTLATYDYVAGPYMLENAAATTITPSAIGAGSAVASTTATITGITKANPGVVTVASATGLADGYRVFISGVVGMVEVNDQVYTIAGLSGSTFHLHNAAGADVDTSGFTAYESGGTAATCVVLTSTASTFSNITGYTHSAGRALWKVNHWIQSQAVSATYSETRTGTAVKCGGTWRMVTHGTWTGTIVVQVSEDGITYTNSRVFLGVNDKNWDTYVTETFAKQFYVRIDVAALSSGSVQIDLSTDPFEWTGVARTVQVPAGGGGSSAMYTTADAVVLSPLGAASATKIWAEGSWSAYRGYPACVAFYQDRLCFAGSRTEADTVWMSKTSNYYDFGTSFPIADDDGISVRMPSREFNLIRNMVALNNLVLMTSAGIYTLGVGGENSVLTPATVSIRSNDLAGASSMTPAVINDRVVYAQTFNKIIRDTGYSFETDGYLGINLNLFAEHLFKEYSAVEMAYQKEPWQTLWVVRSDGKLVSLTYLKQAETYGWAVHATNGGYRYPHYFDDQWKEAGKFLSVCAVPGSVQDDVWVVVERVKYGGTTVRTVEYFSNRNASTDPRKQVFLDSSYENNAPKYISRISSASPAVVTSVAHGFSNDDLVDISELYDDTDNHDAMNGMRFMVKNKTDDTFQLYDYATGLVPYSTVGLGDWEGGGYARKCITTMTGLTCLEGMNASFLKNGIAKTGENYVSSGSVNILGAASVVQAGMPYFTDVEPTDIEFATTTGSTQGKKKRAAAVQLSLFETYGGKIGTKRNNLRRLTETAVNPDMMAVTGNNGEALDHSLAGGAYMGVPPALYTGMYEQSVGSDYKAQLSLIVRQEDPYPITVLSVNADVETT